MKQFCIGDNDAGQRLDRFLRKACPALPVSLLQKTLRLRDVKINGKRARGDERVSLGDVVSVYLPDAAWPADNDNPADMPSADTPPIDIVYEDENILLVNKPAGLSVHEDDAGSRDTLIARIQGHLLRTDEYDPARENSFAPALCHRLDRNTSGLTLAAKNAASLRVLGEKMRSREIKKEYLCIVHGQPSPPAGTLTHFLWKDEAHKQVYVRPDRTCGAKTAITHYRTLDTSGELTLMECRLETGRTHQIRAQLAHVGHPLWGDGKYGVRDGRRYHALCAYRLTFQFRDGAGHLDYLNGQSFCLVEENSSLDELWHIFGAKQNFLK